MFHGPGNGIGEMFRAINQAGKPFVGKSIGDVGFVQEMIGYSQQYHIDNIIILRYVDVAGYPQMVPDYSLPPQQAAQDVCQALLNHLDTHAAYLNPYRQYFRVEVGNELRTQYDHDDPNYNNMHPVDWLGYYGAEFSRLLKQAGWRSYMFGMNAGTPEPQDWLLAGMVEFLTLCASDPYWYGLTLHEGITNADDLENANIEDWVPWTVGRLQFVNQACDQLGIAYPNIVISEWAWKYNDMPSQGKAESDIAWLSEFYAQFPNVEGVNLWNLDRNCGECQTLPPRLANLVPFVRDLSVNWGN